MKTTEKKTNCFNKSGHLNENGIAVYIEHMQQDNELSIPSNIIDHVEDCMSCKMEIFEQFSILNAINSKNVKKAINKNHGQSRKIFISGVFKIAASIILLIGLGVLMFYIVNNSNTSPAPAEDEYIANNLMDTISVNIQELNADTLEKKKRIQLVYEKEEIKQKETNKKVKENADEEKPLLAMNYTPSNTFEAMIGINFRDENIFRIYTPRMSDTISKGDKFTFKWSSTHSHSYTIVILNNRGEKVYISPAVNDTCFEFSKNLSPGLYYWKLETEENLISVNKFYVK